MSTKATVSTVTPVRQLDPVKQVKFKSTKELNNGTKPARKKSSKGNRAK